MKYQCFYLSTPALFLTLYTCQEVFCCKKRESEGVNKAKSGRGTRGFRYDDSKEKNDEERMIMMKTQKREKNCKASDLKLYGRTKFPKMSRLLQS